MVTQKGFSAIAFIGIVTVLAIAASGYIYFRTLDSLPDQQVQGEQAQQDWKTYRNEEYGFEFEYPAQWSLEEEIPGVGALSIVLLFRETVTVPLVRMSIFKGSQVGVQERLKADIQKIAGAKLLADEDVEYNGVTWHRIVIDWPEDGAEGGMAYYYTSRGQSVYEVTLESANKKVGDANILSTFNFIK